MFEGLNPDQQLAVEAIDGFVLILAGAGSGKTRVLTLRMAHLVKNLGVSPKAILGLTFTNKAAAEMRHRIGSLVDLASAKQITLSTFHSFCMQVLRGDIHRLGYTSRFTLYNEYDVQRLIKLIARDLTGLEGELPSLTQSLALIAHAKSRGAKAQEIVDTANPWHQQFARDLYQRLQDNMRAYNAVDFDNLLWLTVELFENYPEVLQKYQERFRYVMIDEYQDTNPIQYRLARLLSGKHQNLCVVGDDDQSIYGWRGADVKNILEFPGTKVIKLEQNYRSSNAILKAANAVISHNRQRHNKVLWSEKGQGEPIEIFHAENDVKEAEAVVGRLAKLKADKGLNWSDIAILYRSNALSRQFELALMKHTWKDGDRWVIGIPYQIWGGLEFYERREVKDLFAYLRVIVNPMDQEAILRVINLPRRGLGEGALDKLTSYNRSHHLPLWQVIKDVCGGSAQVQEILPSFNQKALQGLHDFVAVIEGAAERFGNGPMQDAMEWLIQRINFQKCIEEEVKSDKMREFKWENVQEFVSSLAEYEENCKKEGKAGVSLHDFITTVPLGNDWEGKTHQSRNKEERVNLLTFHSAKGLEFKACYLVCMEDLIIPHEKSMKETGIEEERRLMYVAMTRAMQFLTISMARKRMRMGKEYPCKPSRFLSDIPPDLLKATAPHQY